MINVRGTRRIKGHLAMMATPLLALCFVLPPLFADEGFEALFPEGLVNAQGEALSLDVLQNKIVGIYFSAHWCPPCRRFTPQLVKYRNENKSSFEVVFVSSDRDKQSHAHYMESANMDDWPTLAWNSASAKALQSKFNVRGIPMLVLLSSDGQTLTQDGRSLISQNVEIERLQNAKIVEETYRCGKCDKDHVRQKLLME